MLHAFLDFELDERLFELRHQGQVVPIQTRVYSIIAYLLRHRDRVVGKDELTRELWQATVASDTAISQVVMLARKALRDEGESQRIIKTVRGRGFRFIADVRAIESAPPPVAQPQPAPRPAAAQPTAVPESPVPAGLIGRAAVFQRLRATLAATEAGRGGIMLLEGEPGIGKTTLATALANEATARKLDVHWGRAWEDGGAPPYWPFVQVLRGMDPRMQSSERAFADQSASDLASLIPGLATSQAAAAADSTSTHARFRWFDGMSRFLRTMCRAAPATDDAAAASGAVRPRLIVLDDFHAVDEASIQLLRFLAFELDDVALLIVATICDLDRANPALVQLVESLGDDRRIRLNGLSRDDVSELVTQRLGQAPSDRVTQVLHELSGGNPLLVSEMCRYVGPSGLAAFIEPTAFASMTLPERIASAVRKQLRELPAATRGVLAIASALGKESSMPLLAEVCSVSEADLIDQLAPAFQHGVLRSNSAAKDQLVFSHALVRNAVYADLAAHQRLELHLRVAQLLEQRSAAQPSRAPLFEIAHHYHQAAALGCREQALDYAQRAARQARAVMAFEVAAGLYERAITLAEIQGSGFMTLHALLLEAGDAWNRAGQLANSIDRYDRAAALARSENDTERSARATLRAAIGSRVRLVHDRALQQDLTEALSALPETDSDLRAYLLAASALGLRGPDRLAARDALTAQAVEMCRRLGNDVALLRTLAFRHVALWGLAHPRVTLEIAVDTVAVARRAHEHEIVLDALLFCIANRLEIGDHEGFGSDIEQFVTEAAHRGSPWHSYMVTVFGATEAANRGDFAASERMNELALRQGTRVQDPLAAALYAVRMLFLHIHRGVRKTSVFPQSLVEPPESVPADYHAFWALLWAHQGNHARAAHAISRLFSIDWNQIVLETLRRPLLVVAGQVCVQLEDWAQLERIYDQLLPFRDLNVVVPAGVAMGPLTYHLGVFAAALGRVQEAEQHLELALARSAPNSIWFVKAQFAHGQLLKARDAVRGRELLLVAERGALQTGMLDLRDDIQQALFHDGAGAAASS